jgi:hypothetical protein
MSQQGQGQGVRALKLKLKKRREKRRTLAPGAWRLTWLVPRGQKRTRLVPGLVRYFPIFFLVFFNSPHRETPKNVIKNPRVKAGFGIICQFCCKNFRHDLSKRFLVGSSKANQIYVKVRHFVFKCPL